MKRRRRTVPGENNVKPMGGFLLWPPEDCPAPKKIYRESDGTYWVDMCFCARICKKELHSDKGLCRRAKDVLESGRKKRKAIEEREKEKRKQEKGKEA